MRILYLSFILLFCLFGKGHAQPSDLLAEAKTLYDAGRYTDAVATLDRIIEDDSNSFDIWLIKGDCFQKEEKFVAAIQAYEKAEKRNRESALLLTHHGAAFINLEQYSEATKKISKALKIDPNLAEAHYFMGNLQYFDFNINAAIKSYDEALRLKPSYRDALYMRAASYSELQKYPEALRDYEAALAIDPTLEVASYNVAIIRLLNDEYAKSAEMLAAIDPSKLPKPADYHFYLGEALYFSGKKEDGCAEYEIARDMGDAESTAIYEKYCINKEEREALRTRTIRMAF